MFAVPVLVELLDETVVLTVEEVDLTLVDDAEVLGFAELPEVELP